MQRKPSYIFLPTSYLSGLIAALLFIPAFCQALTYDNQYFPYGNVLYTRKWPRYSNFIPGMMVAVADHSRANDSEATGLFQLFGDLNLTAVGQALETVGQPNPLRSQWRGSQFPIPQRGDLEAFGGTLQYNQAFSDHWSGGVSTAFMRLTTYPRLYLDRDSPFINIALTPLDIIELDYTRRAMADLLGIQAGAVNYTAFTDVDAYLRLGGIFDFPAGFRRADLGLRFGMIAPTGKKRDVNQAYSIPFAGNGLYGLYATGEAELELKEDLKFGFFLRVQQRLSRTLMLRVPVALEPINWGAVVGNFRVHPGTSVAFSLYLLVEDLRGGLGGSVQYLFIKQFGDHIQDQRADQSIPVNKGRYEALSRWQSEVVSARLFYDFSKNWSNDGDHQVFKPIVSFMWDFPVKLLGAPRVSKTNRISITVEVPY